MHFIYTVWELFTGTAVDKGKIFCLTYLINADAEAHQNRLHNDLEGVASGSNNSSNSNGNNDDSMRDIVVTGGIKHMSFWSSTGQNVKSQHGLWNGYKKETILCVARFVSGVMSKFIALSFLLSSP